MARSDQTAFVVEVLEGPSAGRAIELNGRQLPYRSGTGGSISYGREQRTKLTWYPGNRSASQQIIGPRVLPTTINGVWRENYLGEDQPISLVELFESLCDQGVQCIVSWQTIVHKGIVKSIKWSPGAPTGGLTDIAWEITFEWNQADDVVTIPRVGSSRDSQFGSSLDLRDEAVTCASTLGEVIDLISEYVGVGEFFIGLSSTPFAQTKRELKSASDDLVPAMTIQTQMAASSSDFVELPSRLVEDASSASADAQENLGVASDVVAGVFHADVTVDDGLEAVLDESISRYDLIDLSFLALEQQFELRVRLEDIVRPPEFARVVPVPGSDLRELAIRYYGDADQWPRIAKQNGLEGSLIPDDVEEIVIPLSLPDASDDRIGGF